MLPARCYHRDATSVMRQISVKSPQSILSSPNSRNAFPALQTYRAGRPWRMKIVRLVPQTSTNGSDGHSTPEHVDCLSLTPLTWHGSCWNCSLPFEKRCTPSNVHLFIPE